jgi:hypothetical protein
VLTKFWLELLNGKTICRYSGKASLQTYLTVILNRRIKAQSRGDQKAVNGRSPSPKRHPLPFCHEKASQPGCGGIAKRSFLY